MSVCVASCDFLSKEPKAQLTLDTYFYEVNDLILFTNPLYNNLLDKSPYDEQSDQMIQNVLSDELLGGTYRTVPESGGGWSWGTLRRINTYLKYSDRCDDKAAVAKYNAVARFFRAYFYFDKVKRFGDVPWIETELESTDDALYASRDTREFVMGKMLEDIDFAIETLTSDVSLYRVNKWAALALKARFCLYEATWRKYHDQSYPDGKSVEDYLNLSIDAAQQIIDSGVYKLAPDYLTLFAEENADANEYILAIDCDHSLQVTNNTCAYALMSTQGCPGLTKKFVDSFLMKDGTRFTDKAGWETMQYMDEVADRDPRLACLTRTPGYKRIGGTEILAPDFGASCTGFQIVKFVMDCTLAEVDRVSKSYNDIPAFRLGEVYLNYAEAKAELGTLTQDDLDKSINLLRDRVGMPHLSLSEANANPDPYLLSAEYGYSHVEGTNQGVILEIRRERSIELFQEGFRYQDLMRWREGKCIEQAMYGMYFPGPGYYDLTGDGVADLLLYTGDTKPGDKNITVKQIWTGEKQGTQDGFFLTDGEKGYIDSQRLTKRSFDEERDYLYPIPTDDRSLNPNLTQNPNWNDGLDY